jgi:hypothetical protein
MSKVCQTNGGKHAFGTLLGYVKTLPQTRGAPVKRAPVKTGNRDAFNFSQNNFGANGPALPVKSKSNPKLSPIATSYRDIM